MSDEVVQLPTLDDIPLEEGNTFNSIGSKETAYTKVLEQSTGQAYVGYEKAGMTNAGSASTSVRIWAGDTYVNRSTAPFRVLEDGSLYAVSAHIAGALSATSIDIGDPGFHVSGNGDTWWGTTYVTAPAKVSSSGAAKFTNIIVSGLQIGSSLDGYYLQVGTVTGGKLANTTISAAQIANATITGTEIANATITGTKITNGAISATQIATATITSNEIASATIVGGDIANATIAGANIINATISSGQIANATITATNIANSTITTSQIANQTIIATNIANGALTTTQLSSAAGIKGGQIANTTISGGNIATNTINGSNIGLAAITGSNIANTTISGGNVASSTITGTNIGSATITGSNIAGTTIAGSNLINNTISATQIANATITSTQIANATITATEIANLTITAGKIANATITADKLTVSTLSAITADLGTVTIGTLKGNVKQVAGTGNQYSFVGRLGDGMSTYTNGGSVNRVMSNTACTGPGKGELYTVTDGFGVGQSYDLTWVAAVSSTAANRSSLMGLNSDMGAPEYPTYGTGAFTYDHAAFIINSATLYASTANGTTQTKTDISSGLTLTSYNTYRIVYVDASSVAFYVNDVLLATHTTNLPNSGNAALSFFHQSDAGTNLTTKHPFSFVRTT